MYLEEVTLNFLFNCLPSDNINRGGWHKIVMFNIIVPEN